MPQGVRDHVGHFGTLADVVPGMHEFARRLPRTASRSLPAYATGDLLVPPPFQQRRIMGPAYHLRQQNIQHVLADRDRCRSRLSARALSTNRNQESLRRPLAVAYAHTYDL